MSLPVRATVGNVIFHGWSGWTPGLVDQVDEFARIGQKGSGSQVVHSRAEKKACRAWVACATQKDALSVVANIEVLVGVQKFNDQFQRSVAKVRVTDPHCEIFCKKGPIISGTTAANYLVECTLTIEVLPP